MAAKHTYIYRTKINNGLYDYIYAPNSQAVKEYMKEKYSIDPYDTLIITQIGKSEHYLGRKVIQFTAKELAEIKIRGY